MANHCQSLSLLSTDTHCFTGFFAAFFFLSQLQLSKSASVGIVYWRKNSSIRVFYSAAAAVYVVD